MILSSTVDNPAVLSNVGQIGEFRIRNSAKAFNILSSGLYANKIRAIIRELSCNAVDSHVAAGKADTPFELHLPNQLEPWFAVRDFGTGLNHEQVTNIYTTYFESTKTASNEFIGALGLGSKSPFSYTDNFTVTAIQSNIKRIYSAFINEEGVPSIALMDTANTDEANGVEVKFSVNEQHDFYKFRDEARSVYTYFKLRPVVKGYHDFKFEDVAYFEKDIVPGIHQVASSRRSKAVMGNIAYPIDVPNAQTNLGDLASMLECGLELHFDIGELDFQASREGLSYIPQTINSIKIKLEALNDHLAIHVTEKADAINNLWERAIYLKGLANNALWKSAVKKYITDTSFELMDPNRFNYSKTLYGDTDILQEEYNLIIRGITTKNYGYSNAKTTNIKTESRYVDGSYKSSWAFDVESNVFFIKNDTTVGATERARFHFTKNMANTYNNIYVLEKLNKDLPAKFDEFLASIYNPPNVLSASGLDKRERNATNMNKVGVVQLVLKNDRYVEKTSWVESSTKFNETDTYYYLPMSRYEVDCKLDVTQLYKCMANSGIESISKITIYGVRKSHIKEVESNDNWINLETLLVDELSKVTDEELLTMSLSLVDKHTIFAYTRDIVKQLDTDSPVRKLNDKMVGVKKITRFDPMSLKTLLKTYVKHRKVEDFLDGIQKECDNAMDRYPLLKSLSSWNFDKDAIAQYINLIDNNQ